MAETIPSTSDFDALTKDFIPSLVVDNVFIPKPVMLEVKKHMKAVDGRDYTPTVQYASLTGEWYDKGDQWTGIAAASGQTAMKAKYSFEEYRLPVNIWAQDVDSAGGLEIVDLMAHLVKNATKSAGLNLSTALFSTVSKAITPLITVVDNTGTVGGLAPGSYAWWKAHNMEGTGTYSVAVSPSLDNLGTLIRTIVDTCGDTELPDICAVDPDYWNVLMGQVEAETYKQARVENADNTIVRRGFPAIFIEGVPIVRERDCPGAAWVSGQATRALAAGYQALLWSHANTYLCYRRKRSWKWDPDGWRRPVDYDAYLNFLYIWAQVATVQRRSCGRQMNVDITQDIADFIPGTVTLPG